MMCWCAVLYSVVSFSPVIVIGALLTHSIAATAEATAAPANLPNVVSSATIAPKQFSACGRRCPSMLRVAPASQRSVTAAQSTQSTQSTQDVYVSVHPITFAQWHHCVRMGGCNGYRPDRQGLRIDSPVVNVSFDDAMSYVRWISAVSGEAYRLLYEDEWPMISLGGRTTSYPWGDELGRNNANCLDCGSRWDGVGVSPVASFKANDWGLYDTAGNVAHWVAKRERAVLAGANAGTTDAAHSTTMKTGFCGVKPHYAAIVGASWAELAIFMKADDFTCFPKILRDDTIGFRVAVERDSQVTRVHHRLKR
jgi:formylglycine-generating enzyme required for sulfatase activity